MLPSDDHGEQTVAVHLDDLRCPACAAAVEAALRQAPGARAVQLDWPADIVHVRFDPHRTDVAAIERLIASTGCRCEPRVDAARSTQDHTAEATPSSARRLQRLRHGVDVQPITMGTKFDRMQYEAPATAALRPLAVAPSAPRSHDHAAMVHTTATDPPTPDHAAMGHAPSETDHAAMGHDMTGMDYAGMDHDMSDPGMAAAMERDMRNHFFIALLLTIPTVLYSPLGDESARHRAADLRHRHELIMLVLTTPVVF